MKKWDFWVPLEDSMNVTQGWGEANPSFQPAKAS